MKLQSLLKIFIIIVISVSSAYAIYHFTNKKINSLKDNNKSNDLTEKSEELGLRSSKLKVNYEDILKSLKENENYKDVKFYSTDERSFTKQEIEILKAVIDSLPKKLFDYRPWGIISSNLNETTESDLSQNYGIAYSGGPFIFVGDKTFIKDNKTDNGTYRALQRVLSHEFVHVSQYFETYVASKDDSSKISLDDSILTQKWAEDFGWIKDGDKWKLLGDNETTEYGKTHPTEDMADTLGFLITGDKSKVSQKRIDWIVRWLETSESIVLHGTLPLIDGLNQIKVDNNDKIILDKYRNENSKQQDVLKFQFVSEIDKKDLNRLYKDELNKKGWLQSSALAEEFTFNNKYKINFEIDDNMFPVITVVMTVY